ncbi:MAG: hypothetical protein GDA50_04915 [Alphaproteobacteria bacterium GM202ARS2]|nr:hypothetical protein [Alphaproteobacteria bacterium GM202ARS2]
MFILTMVAMVNGCQGAVLNAQQHHKLHRDITRPEVVRETRSLFLRLGHGKEAEDLQRQLVLLDKVIEVQGVAWKMTYRLVPLQGDVEDDKQAVWLERVVKHLQDRGARPRDIKVRRGGHPVGALLNEPLTLEQGSNILVSVDKYVVQDAACLSFYEEEKVGSDLSLPRLRQGCVVENNRLKHAAYPQDLYEAQSLDPALSVREGLAVERYQTQQQGGGNAGGGGVGGGGINPLEGLFGN